MYFLENPNIYHNHNFFELVGITPDRVTTDVYYNGQLKVLDSYNYNDTTQREMIVDVIEKRRNRNLDTHILYEYSYETGLPDHEVQFYLNQMSNIGLRSSDVTFLLHKSSVEFLKQSINKYRFYFLDHFAIKLYVKYKTGLALSARKPLVDRKIAINILVAQLHWKKTRLHTLYYLYRKGLLQTAVTGILTLKENISNLEHEILDKEFWNWLYDHLGPADEVDVKKGHDALISSGFPYSVDIYNNTRVSHICETLCREMAGPSSFLTEKTYRPILNMSPFVLQGHTGHIDFLRQQGFHVFDKYIDLSYDKIPFDFNLIDKTTDATKDLLFATVNHTKEIEASTQHNFKRLLEIGKQEYMLLRKFLGEKV